MYRNYNPNIKYVHEFAGIMIQKIQNMFNANVINAIVKGIKALYRLDLSPYVVVFTFGSFKIYFLPIAYTL